METGKPAFGRAAERLGCTQSAVSRQIAALERSVGGAVFDRPGGPKPVRLTPLGTVVLAHGRELLSRAAATEAAVVARRRTFPPGPVALTELDGVAMVAQSPICDQARVELPGGARGELTKMRRVVFRTRPP